MIFVIDTSAPMSARLALIDRSGRGSSTVFTTNRDNAALAETMKAMVEGQTLTAVAVAKGPGSFTGLRVGVSFGLGLAMGLRIPIIPLSTLDLHAARSDVPVIVVVEAGRGRVYYRLPGGESALGEPGEIPVTYPLVGNVAPKAEAALVAAGHRFKPEAQLRSFEEAAARLLESAPEVAYGSLKLEYMQSFSASKL